MQVDENLRVKEFSAELLCDIKKCHQNHKVINCLERVELHKVADSTGSTLLHYAARWGNNIVALQLIERGADANAQDCFGKTPLMLTLREDRLMTMKILLEANADPCVIDRQGLSAVEIIGNESCITDHKTFKMFFKRLKRDCKRTRDVARILFNANCHLLHVILLNKPRVTRYLLQAGCPADSYFPRNRKTALHVAVRLGNVENVRLLLEHGADVNALNKSGQPPLTFVRMLDTKDNVEIVRLLLSKKPDVYSRDADKNTVMGIILEHGTPKIVSTFLQHGVSLTKKDSCGLAPLHYLAGNTSFAWEIDELQRYRFDVNVRDEVEGYTPLHLAAIGGNAWIVGFLLENGADVNAKDCDGFTPLFYAVSNWEKKRITSQRMCVELLLQEGADVEFGWIGEKSIFDLFRLSRNLALFKPILVHLVIRETLGTPISRRSLSYITRSDTLRWHLTLYRRTVKQMQTFAVYGSVTLFEFLSKSERTIVRYMRNQHVIHRLARIKTKDVSKNYCLQMLRQSIVFAIQTARLQREALPVLAKIMGLDYGSHSVVLNRIVEYLNDRDLLILVDRL